MGNLKTVLVWAEICLGVAMATVGVAQSSSSSSTSEDSLPSLPQVAGRAPAIGNEDVDRLSPQDSAKRNALIQPGLVYLEHGNSKAAYESLQSVLTMYPNDLFVLRYTAAAAMGARQDERALLLFQRALALYPHNPWPIRNAVIILEARLNRWADFDRDLAALRSAKKNGMDHGLDDNNAFVIDEFDAGTGRVQGVIYPQQLGRYHTLYRFLLPKDAPIVLPAQSTKSAAASERCVNPDFQPSIDIESGDVDQAEFAKQHPDKAVKGDRSYMLDAYSSPCVQGLVGFYPDGEPTYERARADAIRVLTGSTKR
jgi:tetratricopeptide (TPR) repeat protein